MKCLHTEFDRAAAGHGTGMDCGLCLTNRIAELEQYGHFCRLALAALNEGQAVEVGSALHDQLKSLMER